MTTPPRAALALLFLAGNCYPQHSDPPEVRALPLWQADEDRAKQMAGHFVFRTATPGEIVVSFPDRSRPEGRVTYFLWLQNRVDPQVKVTVSLSSEGLYVYMYELTNGPDAKTPIWYWDVVGPGWDPSLTIHHPVWSGTNFRDPIAPQTLLEGTPNGSYLGWMGGPEKVAPGTTTSGFVIVSSYRPGLTTAYAAGDGGIGPSDQMPDEARAQLAPLQRIPVEQRSFPAIGPRFPPEATAQDIAAIFQTDIRTLSALGMLNPASAFLKEVQGALSAIKALRVLRKLAIKAPPQSPLEQQLAIALRFSLSSKQP